ncbi:MAG: phenylacetate--CoA ligase family protein [Clostridia bacterium]|nr:phenylacetate--CoA ligase family protein [Clostridia bacterium]
MSLISAMIQTWHGGRATRAQLSRIQQQRLTALVRCARARSPYYRALYANVGENFALSDLPPVTKPDLMAHFDEVVTDRSVTMARIDAFTANPDNIGRMLDGKYLVFRTSGSTGHPAVVLYDQRCVDVSSAVAALRTFARGEDFRAFMKHGKKTAGVFADHGFYLACGMSRYLQLKMPRRQTKITVDVNAPEAEIVSRLNAFGPAMLSGYPSSLSLLADREDLRIQPDVVITGGELLTDTVRRKLSDRFGCYVQTHYSCTEGGEIACECAEGHLHLNEDWVILEPVDSENRPVAPGVRSDKALITNLANFIQPFIRYELTDRIILHDEPCPCGRRSRWLEIEGRTDDILTFAGGVKIAPMSLYKVLEEVRSLRRFQLVQQSPRRLALRLTAPDRPAAFAEARAALSAFLETKGLREVEIFCDDSEPRADGGSGKFKLVAKGGGEDGGG